MIQEKIVFFLPVFITWIVYLEVILMDEVFVVHRDGLLIMTIKELG